MAHVEVSPQEFAMVKFDAARIAAITEKFAGDIGIDAATEIRIEIDERSPLGRTKLVSLDPITITVEGGAFEDPTNLRHLSEQGVQDVLGRLLVRARDRLDPAFGDPPDESELTLPQVTAWDAYCLGRVTRLGYRPKKPRRLYHFRNRHGFTDVADAAFERLWNADALTWSDIEAVCAETAAAREVTSTA